MCAVLVYPISAIEQVMEAVQPMAGFEGVGPCLLGSPIFSTDSRAAHIHPWSEVEMDFLAARVSGITGAVVADAVPKDFVSKVV